MAEPRSNLDQVLAWREDSKRLRVIEAAIDKLLARNQTGMVSVTALRDALRPKDSDG